MNEVFFEHFLLLLPFSREMQRGQSLAFMRIMFQRFGSYWRPPKTCDKKYGMVCFFFRIFPTGKIGCHPVLFVGHWNLHYFSWEVDDMKTLRCMSLVLSRLSFKFASYTCGELVIAMYLEGHPSLMSSWGQPHRNKPCSWP